MSPNLSSEAKRLTAARRIFEHIADVVDASFSIRLWDGSVIPLGKDVHPDIQIVIGDAGVLGTLLRRPNVETLLRHYVTGRIYLEGADVMTFADVARKNRSKSRIKNLKKGFLIRNAIPLLFTPSKIGKVEHEFRDDETGFDQSRRNETDFIQFHYDLSNEFYSLFLDPEMQYSCAYFTDWDNSLEQAQIDKLEMICRKLRLEEGDKLLDIGCGWGGLLCYAAQNYGIEGLGVTLSQKQFDFAREKVQRLGLSDRVKIELRDYRTVEGVYDKIVSVGMYEHIGIPNYRTYFKKIHSLLRDRGILLNHGITRRAKSNKKKYRRINPGKKLLLKYIFPGTELDHIGHTVETMETCGFEVHDVEDWREHYAMTTRHWCKRLSACQDEAIGHVGVERYRMWLIYLASVSAGFADGPIRIYQTVATKHKSKGPSGMPPTRGHLYSQP